MLTTLALFTLLANPAAAATPELVLVKLEDMDGSTALARRHDTVVALSIPEIEVVGLQVPAQRQATQFIARLSQDAAVLWAELDSEVSTQGTPDPLGRRQWNLPRVGATQAWRCGVTGRGAIVAVLDTGLSLDGADTPAHLTGIDLVDGDDRPTDENGHGTHVAGTIAQATGNGVGVGGVARDAVVLPVRVLDADGFGMMSTVAAGIVWATQEGADVINLSLGGSSPSSTVEAAVAFAMGEDVVVVAAAGNDGDDTLSYPAATEGVIAVGATTRSGRRASYSNAGPELSFAAPGGESALGAGILQETLTSDGRAMAYLEYAGTSMATPHVAAAYAMLMSIGASRDEATEALIETATDRGPEGQDPDYGYGEIRIAAAADWFLGTTDSEPRCAR